MEAHSRVMVQKIEAHHIDTRANFLWKENAQKLRIFSEKTLLLLPFMPVLEASELRRRSGRESLLVIDYEPARISLEEPCAGL
jgi:hypothetical protein